MDPDPWARRVLPTTGGRYRVERRLGRSVYEALQLDLGRRVAIKILDSLDETARARFRDEAMIAAALVHPNVVQVQDAGGGEETEENEPPWIVMELLEGRSLRALLERDGRLSLDRALGIAAQIAAALEAAHAQRILHRAIEPSNVWIVDAGDLELVKVLDFGVARLLDDVRRRTTTGKPLADASEADDLEGVRTCLRAMLGSLPPGLERPFSSATQLREALRRARRRRASPPSSRTPFAIGLAITMTMAVGGAAVFALARPRPVPLASFVVPHASLAVPSEPPSEPSAAPDGPTASTEAPKLRACQCATADGKPICVREQTIRVCDCRTKDGFAICDPTLAKPDTCTSFRHRVPNGRPGDRCDGYTYGLFANDPSRVSHRLGRTEGTLSDCDACAARETRMGRPGARCSGVGRAGEQLEGILVCP